MINIYGCKEQHKPNEEELKFLLKCLKPGQKLPPQDKNISQAYYFQFVYENYSDTLLEGKTLKLLSD